MVFNFQKQKADVSLPHISATKSHIVNITNNSNSNKAHSYDGISDVMLKLCAVEVALPHSDYF